EARISALSSCITVVECLTRLSLRLECSFGSDYSSNNKFCECVFFLKFKMEAMDDLICKTAFEITANQLSQHKIQENQKLNALIEKLSKKELSSFLKVTHSFQF